MSVERERQIFEILDEALEQSPRDREAFLDRACGADAAMRQEIEALLDTEIEGGLLSEPAFSVHADDVGIGRQIGPYKLVRLLDRGGMGSVYLAEREDFEQQVALKLIRRGLDVDDLMVRRFENERQILARLDHPHIARLLDGGTTDDRLPYFVMEYVEGVPIDRYCKTHELSIGERLELFRKVCSAVQFAHQNLVVHRDLKPANILITADGQPRLLDFGIAKLLDDSLAASAVATVTGQAAMTPRYASPEQVQLKPVTTASDVYSLGVLLYESLTGLDPYGVDKRRSDEGAGAVCETEPDRPSTAVRRRTREPDAAEARRLRQQLSGDLDSIVLKAMRKEPDQRYASAEQLAEDLRRHLEGLPVGAQTGTFRYRAGKFVRRHKLGMVVAAAFLLLTFSFSALTTFWWRQAVDEGEKATNLSEFLKDLFRAQDPDVAKNEKSLLPDLLERGKSILEESLEEEDSIRITIAGLMGQIFHSQGKYEESRELMEMTLRFTEDYSGRNTEEYAKRLNNLAFLLLETEDHQQAKEKFEEALRIRQHLPGQESKKFFRNRSNLAITLLRLGQPQKAEQICADVLAERLEIYQDRLPDKDVATSRHNLAAVYYAQGRFQEAESQLQRAVETRRLRLGSHHSKVALSLDLRGSVAAALNRKDDAEQFYKQAQQIRKVLTLPDSHRDVARTQKNLAALLATKNPTRADELIDKTFAVFNDLPGDWDAAEAQSIKGLILTHQEHYRQAQEHLVEGYDRMVKSRNNRTYRSRLALQRIVHLFEVSGEPKELAKYKTLQEDLRRSQDLPPVAGDP